MKSLFQMTFILSAGLTDAEPSLWILKHSPYDRRAKLKSETLDGLLRLRINSRDIEECGDLIHANLQVKGRHSFSVIQLVCIL